MTAKESRNSHKPNLSEGYVPKVSRPVREKLRTKTVRLAEVAQSKFANGRARAFRASVSMDVRTYKMKEFAKEAFGKAKPKKEGASASSAVVDVKDGGNGLKGETPLEAGSKEQSVMSEEEELNPKSKAESN